MKGSSKGPESNLLVGRMWLMIYMLRADVVFLRVESKANVADGPSRNNLVLLAALGAEQMVAKLPFLTGKTHTGPLSVSLDPSIVR